VEGRERGVKRVMVVEKAGVKKEKKGRRGSGGNEGQ
jgi:hypothetical protein